VSRARRVGVQVLAGEWASVNLQPSLASRSRLGVFACLAP
jgi:hypothetical protein